MNRNALLSVLGLALAAVAVAGTACPDPYTYHKVDGHCNVWTCGGFYASPYSYTNGGCQTPGNSAYSCSVDSLIINVQKAEVVGGAFQNVCGNTAWLECHESTLSLFGIKKGTSTSTPCNYDCGK